MIEERLRRLLSGIPASITVVAAAKTRSVDEVREVIAGGVRVIGENYVQEAREHIEALDDDCRSVRFEMIGHLQRNKVREAVRLFDMIQTVDSLRLANAIDRVCENSGRVMPILIEVNAAREPQKSGVFPEAVTDLVREIAQLGSVSISGLMTMGPLVSDPEKLRPIFRETKSLFDRIASQQIPGVSMEVLSMGMSASCGVAIEEGSNMVRLGTTIFGPRP